MQQEITTHIINDTDYRTWIRDIAGRYRRHQIKAAMRVADEMLQLYWSIGADIVSRQMENRYGSHFYENVSRDLRRELGLKRGLSESTIKYCKYFYALYSQCFINCQQVADNLEWQNRQQLADDFPANNFQCAYWCGRI